MKKIKRNNTSYSLIGRCGLYCGACDIYRVYIDMKKEKQKQMAEFFRCKPEQVRCHGCQNLTSDDWCSGCKILECLDRHTYRYCYECSEIETCDTYQELNGRYKNLPSKNLKRLRVCGEDRWLKEQRKKWSCPHCGTALVYEQTKCPQCNRDAALED